jgi:hypothetical protein
MSPHQYDLLRALSKAPRTLRSFTHAPSVEQTRVSPYVVELNMGKLIAAGFVSVTGPMHFITAKGRAEVDLSTPTPPQPISKENYKPPVWNVRAGAFDHLQHASTGDSC